MNDPKIVEDLLALIFLLYKILNYLYSLSIYGFINKHEPNLGTLQKKIGTAKENNNNNCIGATIHIAQQMF